MFFVSYSHVAGEGEGDTEAEGLNDALGDTEGDVELEGLTLAEGLTDGETELLGEAELLGEVEEEGDTDGETEEEGDTEGLAEELGDTEGETEEEPAGAGAKEAITVPFVPDAELVTFKVLLPAGVVTELLSNMFDEAETPRNTVPEPAVISP